MSFIMSCAYLSNKSSLLVTTANEQRGVMNPQQFFVIFHNHIVSVQCSYNHQFHVHINTNYLLFILLNQLSLTSTFDSISFIFSQLYQFHWHFFVIIDKAQLPLQSIHSYPQIMRYWIIAAALRLMVQKAETQPPVILSQKAPYKTKTSSGDINVGFLWGNKSQIISHCCNTIP